MGSSSIMKITAFHIYCQTVYLIKQLPYHITARPVQIYYDPYYINEYPSFCFLTGKSWKVEKLFLSHLYQVMFDSFYDQPASLPYVFAFKDHDFFHYLRPPGWEKFPDNVYKEPNEPNEPKKPKKPK